MNLLNGLESQMTDPASSCTDVDGPYHGVIEIDHLDPALGGDLGLLPDLVAAVPDPLGAVGDELHHLGVGFVEQRSASMALLFSW